ncbi:uncharacterized protein LOC135809359 [Sycon ciliatum]|uniref:uncharacterized protein LOC135809359 n=1 Tax=Sycon ciliatum TaxID=27933 RepID=UPI0020AADC3F|eukprot:scpid39998/ scgid20504/ Actin
MASISGNLGHVQDVQLIEGYIPLETEEKSDATWDPTMLINEIFSDIRPCPDYAKRSLGQVATASQSVPMSGLIDKLPSGVEKPSLLKGWKRRFARCQNCNLFYYEDNRATRPLGIIKLAGAKVTLAADHTFRIVEKESGTLFTFRCTTQAFAEDWVASIKEEMGKADAVKTNTPENSVSTIIVDIGSSACRAGFVYEGAYPSVCFPTVMAYDRVTKNKDDAIYGKDALLPSVREKSVLRYPLRTSLHVKKFAVEVNEIMGLIKHAYRLLEAKPTDYKLLLTLPQCVQVCDKLELLSALFEDFHCPAVYLSEQAIMALYSYHLTTGVVVDIGDRMDIVPIVDGVIIENGVTRYPYGGRAVNEAMTRKLAEEGYRMFADVQQYVVKYIKERASYVADNADDQDSRCTSNPAEWTETVDCRRFRMPSGILSVKVLQSRYRACEGFFDPNVFGYDNVGIHRLVEKAIKAAGIDNRRDLCRNILLSGGSTQTKGLPARLQAEVTNLMPAGSQVQVHSNEERHYAAFKGAAVLASLQMFDTLCIWSQDFLSCEPDDRKGLLSRWQ